ncbi:MAG: phosphoglucosamine mutase [Bacteroidota bacterium]|nr:phosphoglucosamine mutase [Bacteroidota bacterium]MDP3145649.1 phosphoglucosamine mutase [Bacteroidota bacterium]
MTLIKSISGIRGTIGGKPDDGLTPLDIVKFTSAYGSWILNNQSTRENITVIIGRDARISGAMVSSIVTGTLIGLGINVVDLGLSTTPTVEMAVTELKAHGGIILTASHNPKQWNALKLLNEKGEFISEANGQEILELAKNSDFTYAEVNKLGTYSINNDFIEIHFKKIIDLPYVDISAIEKANFSIVLDGINSSGGIIVPALLKKLGVKNITVIHGEPTGDFAHNPEPLPEHLIDLSKAVVKQNANLGISVDPDVDRLAFVCEDGEMFGEEYTLVAVADYVLQKNKKGNTVSNLSSTRALRDVTEGQGGSYSASAVGEVNVVKMMKDTNAVIGGEGNGGIILPELHYGRDALVGIAIFLTHLAKYGKTVSMLRKSYPNYFISKNKIELTPQIDVDKVLLDVSEKYKKQPINTMDGVKIEFDKEWVHLRKSNTEPIIRIYSEGQSAATADSLANKIITDIKEIIKS